MIKKVVIAGATGNLGTRITKALKSRGAEVVALVRQGAKPSTLEGLKALEVTIEVVDWSGGDQLTTACRGADCVVSALAGLHDVIVTAQTLLLEGAIRADVPRFIPSDFSTDFTVLAPGENRNFDLRREFHHTLDTAPIAATAVFNGAFAEILNYNIPLLNFEKHTVGYWGDPDHLLDFTSMNDTAGFTAAVALDTSSPRAFHIASFQVSPKDLVRFTAATFGTPFDLVDLGSLEELRTQNKAARAANPDGEQELYARWQQSQYMQSMFSTTHPTLDNSRYADLTWTALGDAVTSRP